MIYSTIPGTGLDVSAVGLGTANFGGNLTEDQSRHLLNLYVEHGGTLLDTAHVYNDWIPGERSRSEKVIGRWLKDNGQRDKIVISTKGAHPPMDKMWESRLSNRDIQEDLDGSLENLGCGYIDLYFLHRDDPSVPVGQIVELLNGFVKEGKIRFFGCSNWSLPRIREAQSYAAAHGMMGFCSNQLMWSLAELNWSNWPDKTLTVMNPEFHHYHLQTSLNAMAFSSQAQGYFARRAAGNAPSSMEALYSNERNDATYERLLKLSRETGTSLSALGLIYFMIQPFSSVPLIACSTEAQLIDCLDAFENKNAMDYAKYKSLFENVELV